MDAIVALCKRRGFVFQSSEIYGGFSGLWDYGPLGVELKRSKKDSGVLKKIAIQPHSQAILGQHPHSQAFLLRKR